ncbi:MAG: endonuclease/exonuclease/phosphatase [Novosphingobium sp. 28-62-57]|uniref:endonuclease/exonuclease/phosphatase family protein n=1 Tax=unclassified Novosphingobium TaxID=2644732 RepID=UPI000BC801BA|nr:MULTISPECIES: endonuclease/exonuclease/phosphatase family protein [unclassified Novosphingobium]OYW50471.1 MAG: endonuclease/exonuclease/phosphatase [Novosphingobium sp. 12-62-10]OYZ11426.1 MAG: endonuclease/exonuclease/phosphatase [Novosphingobium sp. 28-62-57]OZA30564.1 MAG: endonuclease/exonuclease/phosphatase [Novosphingobium sp. 17-62-9]HQS71061.1 endonuclease/exonuclease/phosphatase family protein [Novosphingobium sp.]
MKLAVYNVENLFDRAKAMNLDSWADGRPVLEKFAALNALLGQSLYSDADRTAMADLMIALGLEKSDTGPFVLLRRNRGGLLRRPKTGGIVVDAKGRADWVGSLELRDEPVNEHAMRNTARVMSDLGADVLGVIEAESRPVLAAFNAEVLPAVGGNPFRHVMLIDGNDERGIDVGLMSREGFPIGALRSHVDDRLPNGQPVFSRDCAQFEITTPSGASLLVLVNHLKSKGYGGKAASDAKRKAQAERIAEIYRNHIANGVQNIAIIGDLNDTPDSDPLSPLLQGTDLQDIFVHPAFDDGGYPGTYDLCNAGNKIDYMLLSPALFNRVQAGGVFRKGMWPGSRPRRWEAYAEVTRPVEAGSDHAAIWADIDI